VSLVWTDRGRPATSSATYALDVLLERLPTTADEIYAATGWEIKPEGTCKGTECVPLTGLPVAADGRVDIVAFAERMAMPLTVDEKHGVWALGPRAGGHVLDGAELPELALIDFGGNAFDLASLRGRKVLLIAWASWCGCRFDLPVWQELHAELEGAGLTVVTIDMDLDLEAGRPSVEAANATHPSLIDPALAVVDAFGFTNVPFGLWVDEEGLIVRPPEVAYAPRDPKRSAGWQDQDQLIEQMDPERRALIQGMMMNQASGDMSRYADAVRDWVAHGADSKYVLPAAEVIARSRPRPFEAAQAAAEFELGCHLHSAGHKLDAVPHFEEAHRLDPDNWSYLRQAFAVVDDDMGNPYGTDLLSEVARVGPDTFYPELTI
jgi:peroxiredoxin